jgi:DnaJ-domain-containing protein 1
MSPVELMVGLAGLGVGYWAVSMVFRKKRPEDDEVSRARTRGPSQADAEEQARARARQAPPAARAAASARWYEVLGVAPTAPPNEIRAAYRRLMSQYHPDKVESLGVELRELAERKSKEIGAAYRMGMQVNGVDG